MKRHLNAREEEQKREDREALIEGIAILMSLLLIGIFIGLIIGKQIYG